MTSTGDFDHPYRVGAYLLDCACDSLVRSDYGCPDRRCLVHGNEAEAVNCCEPGGQLTIALTRIYPSRSFPDPDPGTPSNCEAPYVVVVYDVEVLRCVPVGDVERAPSCEQLDDAAAKQWSDMIAVRTGLACCLVDDEASTNVIGPGYRWLFGDHLTLTSSGGCGGSRLTVNVGFPACWECA